LAEVCSALAVDKGLPAPPIIYVNGSVECAYFGLDVNKAAAKLGWRPRITIKEALSELIDHCISNIAPELIEV
jgi:nucleoside-diphosphate-sugar epimerase